LDRRKQFAVATAIAIVIIIYGSLYPFTFSRSGDGGVEPAFRFLVESWRDPLSPGRFLANILFYFSLGFVAPGRKTGIARRMVPVVLFGALLSTSMELLQYFDGGRLASASDVYANTAGTLLGAIGGSSIGKDFRWPLLSGIAANPVPSLLLVAWIGYRLFPYLHLPTIDLRKYWHALQPVLLHRSLTGYDLFRFTAIWLAIGALIEAIVGRRRVWRWFPLFIGGVLVSRIASVASSLTAAETAGAILAIAGYRVLAFSAALRITVIALCFCGYVVAERLAPFRFGLSLGPFGWVPFLGLLSGDHGIDALSFLQKVFLYGGAIWLVIKAGLRPGPSTLLIALMLFGTSQLERFLPRRSAEITDAIMALLIGAGFALIGTDPNAAGRVVDADAPRGWRRRIDWPH
jgi:VanZ like family